MSSPLDKGHSTKEVQEMGAVLSAAQTILDRDNLALLAHEFPSVYENLREAVQAHERDMLDEPVLFSDTTLGKYFEEIQEDGTR